MFLKNTVPPSSELKISEASKKQEEDGKPAFCLLLAGYLLALSLPPIINELQQELMALHFIATAVRTSDPTKHDKALNSEHNDT
jgi:hypothetical protein